MAQNSVNSGSPAAVCAARPAGSRRQKGLRSPKAWVWVVASCAFLLLSFACAQRSLRLRTLWTRPQVHVLFEGYTVSFTIKDINKALELLSETGDTSYGATSSLDTAKDHFLELYRGTRQEYRNRLQPLLQRGVGAFLLTAGRAYIETPKHKKVTDIIVDIQPIIAGTDKVMVFFYDAKSKALLFSGTMSADMYNKDLGID